MLERERIKVEYRVFGFSFLDEGRSNNTILLFRSMYKIKIYNSSNSIND